jgi:hypothetical protein
MEKDLFEYKRLEPLNHFWNCKLKVDVGKHKAGDTIEAIGIDYDKKKMIFYFYDGDGYVAKTEKFKIKIVLK